MARLLFYMVFYLAILVVEGIETSSNRVKITDNTGFYDLPADMQFYVRMMFKKRSVLDTSPAWYWKILGPLRKCMYQVEYEDAVTKYLLKRWSFEDIKIGRRNGKMMSVEMPHNWYVLIGSRTGRYLGCMRQHTDFKNMEAFGAAWWTWEVPQAEGVQVEEQPLVIEDIEAEIEPPVQQESPQDSGQTLSTDSSDSSTILDKTTKIGASVVTWGSSVLGNAGGNSNGTQSPSVFQRASNWGSSLAFWKKGDSTATGENVQEKAPSDNGNKQHPVTSLPASGDVNTPLPENDSQKTASTTPTGKAKQLAAPDITTEKPKQMTAAPNENKSEPLLDRAAKLLTLVNTATADKAKEIKTKASEGVNVAAQTGFKWPFAIPNIIKPDNTASPQ